MSVGVDRPSQQERLARCRRQQTGQHLHGGGLAAAVGAEEAEDLAALDGEADVVDGGEVAEAARQVARHDDRRVIVRRARRNPEFVRRLRGDGQQRHEHALDRGRAGSRLQFCGRAGGQNPPAVHGDQPVVLLGLFHVGGGDQHAHAGTARAHAVDQQPELAARQRIDAGRRLVEDEQVRVVDQRAAQPELLLHAAGELAGRAGPRTAPAPSPRSSSAMRRSRSARSWPNRRPKKSTFSRTLRS